MVRLLLASYAYPPSVGGVEQHSQRLARALVERGHAVHVITAAVDNSLAHEFDEYGVEVTRVAKGAGSRWRKMATYVAGMSAATIRLRHQVDVIQVQQALYPAAAMALVAKTLGKPLVVRNSGSGYHGAVQLMSRLPFGKMGLALIREVATTVSLSEEMTAELRLAGFRSVETIRNGVVLLPLPSRSDARRQLGLHTDEKIVLYVGRLDEEKGTALLADAWRRFGMDATLLVAGDGPQRQLLAPLPRVRIDGFVGDVTSYLAAADVFVLPSISEGISNALLEAMAAGLAVVATDVGGNREVICNARVGRLVEPKPDSLAEAIRELLAPHNAVALGREARRHISECWRFDDMVARYEELYERLRDSPTT